MISEQIKNNTPQASVGISDEKKNGIRLPLLTPEMISVGKREIITDG